MQVRNAQISETAMLAQLWFDGWQDAHAAILPVELARLRTRESFEERLLRGLAEVRVIGAVGTPLGFCMLKEDELDQLFVSAQARGSGVANALMVDAEARLAAKGVQTAWLSCAIGNDRAARFYAKNGWHNTGRFLTAVETTSGPFELEVWRFEKRLMA
ncbi:GNAT family N-acetyltransferase [Dyella choica]|uniref:GNAT family N-acetyltransferase n=1 Tax=Dyella choica TaxID=1927959 RepID=A0A3S0RK68_9GAMM|nr:GNAT family N-acetyltransferase [Dyella choica]RUL74923.1 GNAT family N-acetyltransferase [Dyella choica]